MSAVEVSTDGGRSWYRAELGERAGPHAWREWSANWDAAPGRYELSVRATDGDGNVQPGSQEWNHHGLANTAAQPVPVVVA